MKYDSYVTNPANLSKSCNKYEKGSRWGCLFNDRWVRFRAFNWCRRDPPLSSRQSPWSP